MTPFHGDKTRRRISITTDKKTFFNAYKDNKQGEKLKHVIISYFDTNLVPHKFAFVQKFWLADPYTLGRNAKLVLDCLAFQPSFLRPLLAWF
jgi:hypothetical protein